MFKCLHNIEYALFFFFFPLTISTYGLFPSNFVVEEFLVTLSPKAEGIIETNESEITSSQLQSTLVAGDSSSESEDDEETDDEEDDDITTSLVEYLFKQILIKKNYILYYFSFM